MISSFIVAMDLGNGGHTIADAAQELDACPMAATFAATWRPIPVLVTDGGAPEASDSFAVMAGINRRLVTPLDIMSPGYVSGGQIAVQSPLGFHPSHGTETAHRFVLVDPERPLAANNCHSGVVGQWPPNYNALSGVVTFPPSPNIPVAYPQGSWLVNLGPANQVRKVNYDIVGNVLRSTDLLVAAATPNPIVSNIVLMKAQYGLDNDGNGFIDTWTSATNAWTSANVLNLRWAQPPGTPSLNKIKAIRVAFVVRSSQFERQTDAEGRSAVTDLSGNFTTTLFRCNGLPGCTGEITNVTIPNTQNYRYRVFEQVIPLTNQIWNAS
jgi:type IV pilus assembly protein PilW